MSDRLLGEKVSGTVQGVPISGLWEGRGVWILEILDGKPLDSALGGGGLVYGRMCPTGWIGLKGAYLLDE